MMTCKYLNRSSKSLVDGGKPSAGAVSDRYSHNVGDRVMMVGAHRLVFCL